VYSYSLGEAEAEVVAVEDEAVVEVVLVEDEAVVASSLLLSECSSLSANQRHKQSKHIVCFFKVCFFFNQ
jgi:hypothetical protein